MKNSNRKQARQQKLDKKKEAIDRQFKLVLAADAELEKQARVLRKLVKPTLDELDEANSYIIQNGVDPTDWDKIRMVLQLRSAEG